MQITPALHSRYVPRTAYGWLWPVVGSQVLVAALWWWAGWRWGVAALCASHIALVLGALYPRSTLYMPALVRLATQEKCVWLTIDDGPSHETLAVLELLDAHAARATFFVVGEKASTHPELLREIIRRGHSVGNHSMHHPERRFWALGPKAMRKEIEHAQATITAITGTAPRWFRAVVGMANPFVAAPLHDSNLARVAWSARGYDGSDADAQRVVARVERALQPGAIILAHEGAAHGGNLPTLKLLLQRLDALGYRCVLPD